jgi:hypothetical protein
MKDGVVIINTARGAVMDEAALVEALDSGKVFSAGLDVFEEEPKIHPGLARNPNVMLLPHMGTWTVEVRAAIRSFLSTSFHFTPLQHSAIPIQTRKPYPFILHIPLDVSPFLLFPYYFHPDQANAAKPPQTQTAMEAWALENVRLAITVGKFKSPVPEQADLPESA